MRARQAVERLTPSQLRRLEALRRGAQLLDSAVSVPGTSYRIGLDPIVGLVPGVGDLISPLFALAVLWHARDFGVPRIVQLRMVLNVAIDAMVGVVPILGDLFDFAWKANARNLALLERHAAGEPRGSAGDWLFVAGVTVLVLAIAVLPILFLGWIVGRLFS